eukprot:PhM_4_TR18619/c0_g1_i1/m.83863
MLQTTIFSVRWGPVLSAVFLVFVSVLLSATITYPLTFHIVDDSHTLSNDILSASNTEMSATAAEHAKNVLSHSDKGAELLVTSIVDRVEAVAMSHRRLIEHFFAQNNVTATSADPFNVWTMVKSNLRPGMIATLLSSDVSNFAVDVVPLDYQLEILQAPFSYGVELSERVIFEAITQETSNLTSVCPLGEALTCNSTFSFSASLIANVSFVRSYDNFPWLVANPQHLSQSQYMQNVLANITDPHEAEKFHKRGFWTPVQTRDRMFQTFMTSILDPRTNKPFVTIGASLDTFAFSSYVKRLVFHNHDRAFVFVYNFDARVAGIEQTQGILVAASHGSTRTNKVVRSPHTGENEIVAVPILVTESDDALISSAGHYMYNHSEAIVADQAAIHTISDKYGHVHFTRFNLVRRESGIHWMVVTMVSRAIFLDPVEKNTEKLSLEVVHLHDKHQADIRTSQLILGLSLMGLLFVVVFVSFHAVKVYSTPIVDLSNTMALVASLDLDVIDDIIAATPMSKLVEVRSMQHSFKKMVQDLRELRAYVPDAVLVPHVELQDPLVPGSPTASIETTTTTVHPMPLVPPIGLAGQNNHDTNNNSLTASLSVVSPSQPVVELITSVSAFEQLQHQAESRLERLKTTNMKPYTATFVCVQLVQKSMNGARCCETAASRADQAPIFSEEVTSQLTQVYQDFVSHCLGVIDRFGGTVVRLEADYIVASWNAFRPCSQHDFFACAAAADLRATSASVNVLVAGGEVLVGFLGTERKRSPCIQGPCMKQLDILIRLACELRSGVLLTEHVAHRIGDRVSMCAVDVVSYLDGSAIALYELCSMDKSLPQNNGERMTSLMALYNTGFSRLRVKSFSAAIESFTKFLRESSSSSTSQPLDKQRAQAVRLLRIACWMQETDDNNMGDTYSRRYPLWEKIEMMSAATQLPYDVDVDLVTIASACSDGGTGGDNVHDIYEASFDEDMYYTQQSAASVLKEQMRLFSESTSTSSSSCCCGGGGGNEGHAQDPFTEFAGTSSARYHRSGRLLGKGAMGSVYLGLTASGSQVALKCIKYANATTSSAIENILSEVHVMSTLKHDNIVALIDTSFVGGEVVIVQEFVGGGSLHTLQESFTRVPVRSVQRYLRDILHGLAYLHRNDILHRDIKPHNILLSNDGVAKLADFGTAATLTAVSGKNTFAGTPVYMSPEACRRAACKASDIWATGVTTVELLTGLLPFTREQMALSNNFADFVRVMASDVRMLPKIPPNAAIQSTPGAKDFILRCFEYNIEKRPNVEVLLAHEFLMQ